MYLKDNPPLKKGVKLTTSIQRRQRRDVATSLGADCVKFAPFIADYTDQETVLNGAKYRFLRETPKIDRELMQEFRLFCRDYVRKTFDPIKPCEVDFEDYLAGTHYTLRKKETLRNLKEKACGVPQRVVYKSFGKSEFININEITDGGIDEHLKNVRCINGPEDRWKVFVAPLIHAVEKKVCKLKYFAKYIPVKDRAQVIYDTLASYPGPYYVTDYTSFEASFSQLVLEASEGELYDHMLQHFDERRDVIRQMCGIHKMKYRGFTVSVPGVRMSGDSNTSLGNGFTNLMLTMFMCKKMGLEFHGFVEGDDGIFVFSGQPDFTIMRRLGFDIKLEPHQTLFTTSFCGLMLSRSLAQYTDPVYEIVKFGWSTSAQRNSKKKSVLYGLLRAKALSLFYCHPRCPMVTTLALKFIQLTQEYKPIFGTGFWEKKIVEETIKFEHDAQIEFDKGITDADRADFNSLYHITPEIQVAFERYVSGLDKIQQLDHWSIDAICVSPHLAWMAANYVVEY